MLAQLVFIFLAVLAIAAALGLVISRNPVTSALWLILNLFCIAGLYLSLQAQFMFVIQILVYAGAIMVLFLFVIMLLNLGALPSLKQFFDWKTGIGFILSMAVLTQIVYIVADGLKLLPTPVATARAVESGSARALAQELFTRHIVSFEMIGILLLVATIGAVILAKRRFA